MTGSRRPFDIAEFLQLSPHGRLVHRDRKFLGEPLNQIAQSPAHNTVDCRDRTALDDLDQRLALRSVELGLFARRLAVEQSIRIARIEPHDPIPHNLQANTDNASRIAAPAAVVNLRKCQEATAGNSSPGHALEA